MVKEIVVVTGKWDSSEGTMDTDRYNSRSMETLVVVLAVITIVAVFAGLIARLCGGRHIGASGEHDIEGWVERNCRSCIDGGLPPPPPPPPPPPTSEAEKK